MRIAVFGLGYVGTVTAAGLASPAPRRLRRRRRRDEGRPASARAAARSSSPASTSSSPQASQRGFLTATTGRRRGPRVRRRLPHLRRHAVDPAGRHGPRLHRAGPSTTSAQAMDVARPPVSGFHAVVVRSTVPAGHRRRRRRPASSPTCPDGVVGRVRRCAPSSCARAAASPTSSTRRSSWSGTDRARATQVLGRLFAFLDRELRYVDVRTRRGAQVRLQRLPRHQGLVRQRDGPGLPALRRRLARGDGDLLRGQEPQHLPGYLRPGFAFGGSCLPKDLRALLHMARVERRRRAPALGHAPHQRARGARRRRPGPRAAPARVVAMLGLSFKMDTDDLRESPNVELAERLLGKGFEVRIYDPIINPARLVGANLRYVEARLPHLSRLLAATPQAGAAGQRRRRSSRRPTRLSSPRCAGRHRSGSSTSAAGSAPTSSGSPATRASAGPRERARDRGAPRPRGHGCSSSCRTSRCPSTAGSGWSARP